MPRKAKRPGMSVKVDMDVLQMARIIAAIEGKQLQAVVSDTLRPLYIKTIEAHQKAGRLLPKP